MVSFSDFCRRFDFMEPNNDQITKIASLRAGIQHAVAQADRGEVIRDFKMEELIQECHLQHAVLAKVKATQ